ncbi:hypothetical protein FHR70_001818 [Microvirga lupini]|uniref:Uncharacterized protein n=1 Tax=Microvirga lupini TaxID=420324 RepID=A0A7W4VKA3_9HYPH|nr:hypothetical protein [Microvirga lupini]MBB3018764.1 hypothetical protein [Microvirga lupini]
MDDLTSKMDGITVDEWTAATEANLALASELTWARAVKVVLVSASNAAVGAIA